MLWLTIRYLLQAYWGKWIWMRLRRKYGTGFLPSRYILFPSKDPEYNHWGVTLLPTYLAEKHIDKVMLLTTDETLAATLQEVAHSNKHILKISPSKMHCLLRLAALVNLNEEMTIVSVKEPYDTCAERLLGKRGVTKKEIVWYDIYHLADKYSETRPY